MPPDNDAVYDAVVEVMMDTFARLQHAVAAPLGVPAPVPQELAIRAAFGVTTHAVVAVELGTDNNIPIERQRAVAHALVDSLFDAKARARARRTPGPVVH